MQTQHPTVVRRSFLAVTLLLLVSCIILAGLIASVMRKKKEVEDISIPTRLVPQMKKTRVTSSVPVTESAPMNFVVPVGATIGDGTIGRSNLTHVGSAKK